MPWHAGFWPVWRAASWPEASGAGKVRSRKRMAARIDCARPFDDTAECFGDHSAPTDWTVQAIGMLPRLLVDETSAVIINQIAVLPLLSRHRMSLLPSPL
jgi:hypothetical protein